VIREQGGRTRSQRLCSDRVGEALVAVALSWGCGPSGAAEVADSRDANGGESEESTGTGATGSGAEETDGGTGPHPDLPPLDEIWTGEVQWSAGEPEFAACEGERAPLRGLPSLADMGSSECSVPLLLQFFGRYVPGDEAHFEVVSVLGGLCREGGCPDASEWRDCKHLPADPLQPPLEPWFAPLCTTPAGCGFGCDEPDDPACPGGDKCTIVDCGGPVASCRPAGTAAIGEGCFADPSNGTDSCAPGSVCYGGVCHALCVLGAAGCDLAGTCVDVGAAIGMCLATCDPGAPDCGPQLLCSQLGGADVCTEP
jgi:hypothetical protein